MVTHQLGDGAGRLVTECGRAVRLCRLGLRAAQLSGHRLVADRSLGEGAFRKGLPLHFPEFPPFWHLLLVQDSPAVVPDPVTITDAEAWGAGRRDNVLTVRAPGEVGGVGRLGLRHLFVLLHIPDLHLATQVPKAGENQQVALGAIEARVPGPCAEVEYWAALEVKNGGLRWHEAIHHAELRGAGAPRHVVDGPVLR